MALDILDLMTANNIAEMLEDMELNHIGSMLCEAIESDDSSRSKWLTQTDKWLELAEQVMEPKSYPWPDAANVKYPLLSTAAIQFHARSYPALIGNKDIVKAKTLGMKSDAKTARAERIMAFMSYQIFDQEDTWQDEMDRLLFLLAIVGLVYKKTYYSPAKGRTVSEMVSARDVIVNYHASNFERARVTHRFWQDGNEVQEYINQGIYVDADLSEPETSTVPGTRDKAQGLSGPGMHDDLAPYEIYESHCWLDLDEDGYKEPYIVTVTRTGHKVLRIVARWESQDIIFGDHGVVKITPTNYFTQYKFIPDPESKIYALGFGALLGPTNKAVNTIINQLLDAGHLSTIQGGFLSRGVRVPGGVLRFKPGEWKQVQSTGEDLAKGIFPLPVKEPSSVLFSLLGLLITSGKDLSSIQDIHVGKTPGQNTPLGTTQAALEQGMQVFNGIYKRVYRSLSQEFKKMYKLNGIYVTQELYQEVLDDPNADPVADFSEEGIDVIPSAEPDMIIEARKVERANALLLKAMNNVPINLMEVTRRMLEAEGHEDIEALMTMPPPQTPPDIALEQAQFEHQVQMDQARLQLDALKIKEQAFRDRISAMAKLREVELKEGASAVETEKHALEEYHRQRDEVIRLIENETKVILERMKLAQHKEKATSEKTGKSG